MNEAQRWANALEDLRSKPITWLETVYAEWLIHGNSYAPQGLGFDHIYFERIHRNVKKYNAEQLVELIWEMVDARRQTGRGDLEAFGCPYGCEAHFLEFIRPTDDEGET
jgi:hypothetical protein